MKLLNRILVFTVLAIFPVSCWEEPAIEPERQNSDLLFEFPQGTGEIDREIQRIQEDFDTYVIYKDISDNLLNRAWINLYPGMTLESSPVPDNLVQHYVGFIEENLFSYFDSGRHRGLFPKYIFLVDGLHREENGVAKAHIPVKTDGVDFWAVSFQSDEDGNLLKYNEKTMRITLVYQAIVSALDDGLIEIPSSFYEEINYKDPVYGAPNHEWHYQTRGFVKYVQPTFEYETPATDITVIAMANADFLMYVRKILFSTPETFRAENENYSLVMKRYQIVLNLFEDFGIDLNAVALGE
ncbi:MAG: hypothetical protein ACI4UJ_09015 [Candidatus Cryptobacteroides sp.]